MSEILVTSLRNRIRALNTIWERAVSDMTLEQVNHHERPGVLPLAFSMSHYIRSVDQRAISPGAAAVAVGRLGRASRRHRRPAGA
ncbi:MAG: hypothetical protein IH959_04895 [Chloroflexi bacterium]|nr:hypothetical protein [Chloroflexota bacterium]